MVNDEEKIYLNIPLNSNLSGQCTWLLSFDNDKNLYYTYESNEYYQDHIKAYEIITFN